MGVIVHLHNQFDLTKRNVHRLDKPMTVRKIVQRHKGLRRHTHVFRPGGIYGRRKVREFSRMTACLLNGKPLLRKDWKRTTVGQFDVVTFYAPPGGGDGFRMVAMIALIALAAAATWWAGGAGGAALASSLMISQSVVVAATAVTVAAISYGVMSLFTPAAPPTTGTGYAGSTPATSPTYNLTAQGNYARLQSPIPEAFGRNRLFPDFVTTPYAQYTYVDADEVPGSVESTTDQWLHHIVGLGIGEYDIDEDELKFGDTPIDRYPDVEWAVIEPGALPDLAIADERWITSPDLADHELLDDAEGSPWAGPFIANPPQTTINKIEVDFAMPRGLWAYNEVTYLAAREVTVEIEAQEIDDAGATVGGWETFDPITVNRKSQELQRVTVALDLPTTARWQVRVRRTDTKETGGQAGHQVDWIGLRGRVVGRRTFPGMTCISLKMKAGEALNSAQSRRFNLVAVRKLETWEGSAMGTTKIATRNPCDAFAYIARTSNGGRLRDAQIDLAGLYANYDDFEDNQWWFNFVFDNGVTVSEALARVSRAVIAERVVQGGKLHLVRDVPVVAPVAMFSPRNMLPGFTKQYMPRDSTSPDALIGTYIDQRTWQPIDVTVAFDDSAQERPTRLTLHGVSDREQARAVLWHMAREDRYRRAVYAIPASMEGLAVTFGDGISFSHDVPNYGQTLEVIDYDDSDPLAPVFTFVDEPVITPPTDHYAAVRDGLGRKAGPFRAHRVEGEPYQLWLQLDDPGDLPEILIGGGKERTWLQVGPGEAYAKPLKVKQVMPRDEMAADIIAFDDDPRMYDELPEEPDVPIGVDTEEPITVVVTTSGNLRTKANEAGYSGQAVQQVTFTVAAGVDVALIRGSWPVGAEPILELTGTLSGADGAGGAGGAGGLQTPDLPQAQPGYAGNPGGVGGTALDSATGALTVTGSGTIRGGKGGGGGGGGGGGAAYFVDPSWISLAGGNGGTGNGGTGGAGSSAGGETSGDGGDGGAAASSHGAVGNAGSSGDAGSSGGAPGAGGVGGAGGKAIVGVANVDLTGFSGLIIGATS